MFTFNNVVVDGTVSGTTLVFEISELQHVRAIGIAVTAPIVIDGDDYVFKSYDLDREDEIQGWRFAPVTNAAFSEVLVIND